MRVNTRTCTRTSTARGDAASRGRVRDCVIQSVLCIGLITDDDLLRFFDRLRDGWDVGMSKPSAFTVPPRPRGVSARRGLRSARWGRKDSNLHIPVSLAGRRTRNNCRERAPGDVPVKDGQACAPKPVWHGRVRRQRGRKNYGIARRASTRFFTNRRNSARAKPESNALASRTGNRRRPVKPNRIDLGTSSQPTLPLIQIGFSKRHFSRTCSSPSFALQA
jgi:hypothetical protein